MAQRKIETVLSPGHPHFVGNGFRVSTFIPRQPDVSMRRMSPFIMLDYNPEYYFEPTDQPRGVGVHPHKGFETVTIAYKGKVAHEDSTGSGGVIEEGDVQWMTAGGGILHKEYHEENFSKEGGYFQMVQLWVNLPSTAKETDPRYQSIRQKDMKRVELPEDGGVVEVIAGEYKNEKGPADTFTPIHLFNAKLNKGADATFHFPEYFNTALLVVEGPIKVNNNQQVAQDQFAVLENEGKTFTIRAEKDSVVLIMSGEPIDEPIAAHGPFVMNTKEELKQAFEDYNKGKFGYLED